MNYELKDLQIAELYIAKEIKRICNLHHIQYTMIGGTLIGAVRHKGFIPWDDDIDFVMTRENYIKFLKVCEQTMSDEFELQNWHTDRYFNYPFSKLLLKGTIAIEKSKLNSKCQKKIFVDIIPFDRIPDGKLMTGYQFIFSYFYKKLAWLKYDKELAYGYTGAKKIRYLILHVVAKCFSRDFIINQCEKYMTMCCGKHTVNYTSICGTYGYFKEITPSKLFENYVELPFEDTSFMAVSEYDHYLKQVFGDYMQLPPREKQKSHGMATVNFGDFFKQHSELKRK